MLDLSACSKSSETLVLSRLGLASFKTCFGVSDLLPEVALQHGVEGNHSIALETELMWCECVDRGTTSASAP